MYWKTYVRMNLKFSKNERVLYIDFVYKFCTKNCSAAM
jgi:hypothetical protein